MTLLPIQKELRKKASAEKAKGAMNFFKTGKGQYGEGDLFIGVTVPETRALAKANLSLKESELKLLLNSPIHEDRLLALIVLVAKYEKERELLKKEKIVKFYLSHKKRINNWDLVDLSVSKILGHYCHLVKDHSLLAVLATSKHHWDRRMAMVATYAFIKADKLDLTFAFAISFLNDKEDLMHKATGWMLREAGKRDFVALKKFVEVYGSKMPRTMLRYAIEHYEEGERKKVLALTKS